MRTLRQVASRPCEGIRRESWQMQSRCPRDNTCAPCQAFWLLVHDQTPITWVIVSTYWIAKIS